MSEMATGAASSVKAGSGVKAVPKELFQTKSLLQALEPLFSKVLFRQLDAIGLFADNTFLLDEASARIRIPDAYGKWLVESLRILSRNGFLEFDGQACAVLRADVPALAELWEEWDESKMRWRDDAQLKAHLGLLEATLRALPDLLTGRLRATEVLFPNGSMELLENVYKNNGVADYFNGVLVTIVLAYLERRLKQDPQARIRILEVGAGTGGTSALLLAALQPYQDQIEEYCYTDVSRAFLWHAEKAFGTGRPFLRYQLFDVSRPLAAQDLAAGSYDLVVATNVLHATPQIALSVRNAKAALRTNGLLLLNEISQHDLLAHLTFGLLEGWWLYEDASRRIPGSPGLAPETWEKVLREEGFQAVFFPVPRAHALGQQVVVAESDGIVRQRVAPAERAGAISPPPAPAPAAAALVARPLAGGTGGTVDATLRAVVLGCIAETLKLEPEQIEEDRNFADYGFDSILAVGLVNLINERCGLNLAATVLFDYSSAARLTRYLLDQHQDELAWMAQAVAVADAPAAAAPVLPVLPVLRDVRTRRVAVDATAPASSFEPERAEAACDPQAIPAKPNPVERDGIAIIGISGRFARSPNPAALWTHLAQGVELVDDVARWDLSRHMSGSYCKRGSLLEAIDEFDARFFNISGQEAAYMDPQQRLFLEDAWTALEDAGQVGPDIDGLRCGVYVGCSGGDYASLFEGDVPAQSLWGIAPSITAARIAYHLNLQGPAVAVDTACSASLVAVHLACQGLWSKETDLALAGGVSVYSTPAFYNATNKAGMLSASGRCHTFDERADGFVPGEGVAAVVLKRVQDAVADGDHIYGIIRGSGINQDGATNGITAPSALSQERLERSVYDTFGIDPAGIQMVEAHGTGTRLGDPIEFRALRQAFRAYTDKRAYCALGSIKTNLGHTVATAGVAGMLKILLSLKHKQIPASLHYTNGNPNIAFDNSPFYVNTALRPWEVEPGRRRCAAVSSFGFSGTNAHVVIEEAPQPTRQSLRKSAYLIAASARTEEQLRQQLVNLLGHLEGHADLDMGDLSYTLLCGRRHFSHRLACIAQDGAELRTLLHAWLNGEQPAAVCTGTALRVPQAGQASLAADVAECMARYRETQGQRADLAPVADLYCQGQNPHFKDLFAERSVGRIPLPTYPFVRERYWVPQQARPQAVTAATQSVLHPLLHRNTSTLAEQRFSSRFGGEEFFLSDHVVGGRKILPGVAHLEMARAALHQALDGAAGVRLQNVVWSRPIVVGSEPQEVHIGLYPQDDGQIAYEIYADGLDGEAVVYSQGVGVAAALQEAPMLDIGALRNACPRVLEKDACYAEFARMGMGYGAGFRTLESLHVGDGQVLGRLALQGGDAGAYQLHPGLMDGALQAAVGLLLDSEHAGKAIMPFAIESVEIYSDCTAATWVACRERPGRSGGDELRRLDFDVCDAQGRLCVRLGGVSARIASAAESANAAPGTLLLRPCWRSAAELTSSGKFVPARATVVLCGMDGGRAAALSAQLASRRCVPLAAQDIVRDYPAAVRALLHEIRHLMGEAAGQPALIQVVVPAHAHARLWSGLSGLLKTAKQEYSTLSAQLVIVEDDCDDRTLAAQLEAGARSPEIDALRWQDGEASTIHWEELKPLAEAGSPWRGDGIYLVTGGLGGLGYVFAREIAQRCAGATLVLCGRSALIPAHEPRLAELKALGARVVYRQADVAQAEQAAALVQGVVADFGSLHGIVHCAGARDDGLIAHKADSDGAAVIGPKVTGLLVLDEASRSLPLECFVLCSSAAAAMGNVGQADYAAANGFMDAYAAYRNSLLATGQRHGHTLSVNWPLWAEGGMQLDAASAQRLQIVGAVPLETQPGIAALYQAWTSGADQVLVLAGRVEQLRRRLTAAPMRRTAAPATVNDSGLLERVKSMLAEAIVRQLQIKPAEIRGNAELSEYGFDSISLTQFGNALSSEYGIELSPAIFFEYRTLDGFAGYLVSEHAAVLAAKFGTDAAPAHPAHPAPLGAPPSGGPARGRRARFGPAATRQEGAGFAEAEPVAVIGLSVQLPMAEDQYAFWRLLHAGEDCAAGAGASAEDMFERDFFALSEQDAAELAPEQRLLMRQVWQAMEDAGHAPGMLAGSDMAVFVASGEGVARRVHDGAGIAASSGTPGWLSHWFDLHGPSQQIDVAGSGALVALRRATAAIQQGDCETAIVAAVEAAQADSERGASAAVLVLKQRRAAERDGDHIYGLVRGGAEQHGGRAMKLGVPVPEAMDALFKAAYRQAELGHNVGYIELHHAGSELGDALEIGGLKSTFEPVWQSSRREAGTRCGLGSVKANIGPGRCSAVAGLAGVIKVLLQLKHKTLAPSLHAETTASRFALQGSPFHAVRAAQPWPAPRDARGWESARRAGVSAFGMSGVNVHLLIDEYIPPAVMAVQADEPAVLVVLSAHAPAALHGRAAQLLAWIERTSPDAAMLRDMAYTLQLGREPMAERLALLADSPAGLGQQLAAYLDGTAPIPGLYRGTVMHRRSPVFELAEDDDIANAIEAWMAKRKFGKLLNLWVKGWPIDWRKLYDGTVQPRRLSLPAYPFEASGAQASIPDVAGPAPAERPAETVGRQVRPWRQAAYAAPRGSVEQRVAAIWARRLDMPVDDVGIHDDFFDCGGNDELARLLIDDINAEFATGLAPHAPFEAPTIERLATLLEAASASPAAGGSAGTAPEAIAAPRRAGSLAAVPRDQPLPLSFAQQRLWFLDQFDDGIVSDNVVIAARFKGWFDAPAIRDSLNAIVRRHEVLRTSFPVLDEAPVQRIAPALPLELAPVDLAGLAPAQRDAYVDAALQEQARMGFDLACGPLIRARLLRLSDTEHVFLVAMHHIVSDGWSVAVFFRELVTLYQAAVAGQARSLPELPVQYADYAHWQRKTYTRDALAKELAYWRERLQDAPALLDIPTDHPRPPKQRRRGESTSLLLPAHAVNALRDLAKANQATLFMAMLAVLKLVLHRWSGQDDLVVGTVTAGRTQAELEGMIGCFNNFLPLRTRCKPEQSFESLLTTVSATVIQAYANQNAPFEQIIEVHNPVRSSSHNPIFNTAFLLHNFPRDVSLGAKLNVEMLPLKRDTALMDLRFVADVVGQDVCLHCEYNTDLFDAATIEALLAAYEQSLAAVLAQPDTTLAALPFPDVLREQGLAHAARKRKQELAIAATFTAEPMRATLEYWMAQLELPTTVGFAPYNQVFQTLLDPRGLFARNQDGVNLVLVRLEDWIRDLPEEATPASRCEVLQRNADELIEAVRAAAGHLAAPLFVAICPMSAALRERAEYRQCIGDIERQVDAALAPVAGVHRLGMAELADLYPVAGYDDSYADELGHVPYTADFYSALGTLFARKVRALRAPPRKVVVLDCDNTLWQGVCGESGPHGVQLTPDHLALQEFMVAQAEAGMLLCLCSKNSETDVEAVFRERGEMPLKRDRIVATRINWLSKSANLQALADELQLGLDSFIFADDNPVECAEVQANCPGVLVLQLPEQAGEIGSFLRHVWAFDHLVVTRDASERTEHYRQNQVRRALRTEAGSFESFLASLELKVALRTLEPGQCERAAELTQRTNQFNLRPEPRQAAAMRSLMATHVCQVVEVEDRFGSYGVAGLLAYRRQEDSLLVDTFLLSCRVLGRGVEQRVLAALGEAAQALGCAAIALPYAVTARNQPMRDFLAGVAEQGTGAVPTFVLDAQRARSAPPVDTTVAVAVAAGERGMPAVTAQAEVQQRVLPRIGRELGSVARIAQAVAQAAPRGGVVQRPYVAPGTPTEEALAQIWREVLNVDRVGVHDNFFDLGGHSLVAVQMSTKLRDRFQVELPLKLMFENQDVGSLAKQIDLHLEDFDYVDL
jgi:polyketide synthase PksN